MDLKRNYHGASRYFFIQAIPEFRGRGPAGLRWKLFRDSHVRVRGAAETAT